MLKVINPFDQSIVVELPFDDQASVQAKLNRSEKAFRLWRYLPVERRIDVVRKGLERFRKKRESIAHDITRQMGKPIVQARREVDGFFERADYMVSIAGQELAPENLPAKDGFIRRIEHAPLGVVLNLAAWNYPLLIAVNVVVPALLAGNTVLLKHSALTPLCGQAFEDAFGHLEIEGLVTSLILSHEDTEKLIGDSRIAYVAFTGSVQGGRRIYQTVAKRFIDVGLELGGKDPAYVAADADLDFAVANIVDGVCYNAGQSCCSVERVYVHRSLYPDFLKKAEALMKEYVLGDPMKETTTMGPLASRSALPALEEKILAAEKAGARVLLGGRRLENTAGNFFIPSLVADVPNPAALMQEESFAAIMPVQAVAGDDEALERMNDASLGLTASVWTQDLKRAERFGQGLEAGTIFLNRCDYLDPALPWTGVKDSGKGSTLSKYGFHHLTRRKSIHFRLHGSMTGGT